MGIEISAIIITKNEESNIKRCLDSLTWVNEIIIVDSYSTDSTVAIANTYSNAKVYSCEWLGYAGNKIFGLKHTTNNWILWIDADEEVSPKLKTDIELLFKNINTIPHDAYTIARKTWFVTAWILHCGWYPDKILRLFRKDKCEFNTNILHEGVTVYNPKNIAHLSSNLHHYSYPTIDTYFKKLVHYGPLGAAEAFRKGKKPTILNLLLRPIATFIRMYFLKLGFLDGVPGLIVCLGSAFSTFTKYTHLYYLNNNNTKQ